MLKQHSTESSSLNIPVHAVRYFLILRMSKLGTIHTAVLLKVGHKELKSSRLHVTYLKYKKTDHHNSGALLFI